MLFADLPPELHEPVACLIEAAIEYNVPANILLAIAEKEGGKPGQWVRNTNGTYDVGPMQFNSAYLKELMSHGVFESDVAAYGCYPYQLAAWRIRDHIYNDQGDLWTRAANYHSRTPTVNAVYRADLMTKAERWSDWVEQHYITYEVNLDGLAASMQFILKPITLAPETSAVKTLESKTPPEAKSDTAADTDKPVITPAARANDAQ